VNFLPLEGLLSALSLALFEGLLFALSLALHEGGAREEPPRRFAPPLLKKEGKESEHRQAPLLGKEGRVILFSSPFQGEVA
jgi:hypothetical protein